MSALKTRALTPNGLAIPPANDIGYRLNPNGNMLHGQIHVQRSGGATTRRMQQAGQIAGVAVTVNFRDYSVQKQHPSAVIPPMLLACLIPRGMLQSGWRIASPT